MSVALVTGWPPSEVAELTISQLGELTKLLQKRNRGR